MDTKQVIRLRQEVRCPVSTRHYDFVVLGAGIFGLYAARLLGKQGRHVAVVDCDQAPYSRASHVNQARLHQGYHYPRSVYTALKVAGYYERFVQEFGFALNQSFRQVYAISRANSYTNAEQFRRFCNHVGIPCDEVDPGAYFRPGMVEAAFETNEVALDPALMRDWLLQECRAQTHVALLTGWHLQGVQTDPDRYRLDFGDETLITPAVLNATYSGTNQVAALFGHTPFQTKYELCEVALVEAAPPLAQMGITVMDGPFFSLMPFGSGPRHSLTAVPYTPHFQSSEALPRFDCQERNRHCSPQRLANCNDCPIRPVSAWRFMAQMARQYLQPTLTFRYTESMYAMKVVLRSTETSDSRPTVVQRCSERPFYAAVLSGKLNTVYDLEASLP